MNTGWVVSALAGLAVAIAAGIIVYHYSDWRKARQQAKATTPAAVAAPAPGPPATGQITEPFDSSEVGRVFDCAVSLANARPAMRYWLANEVEGLHWPKAQVHPDAAGAWRGQCNEGGSPPQGRFKLTLWEVGQTEHRAIMAWSAGPSFPGRHMDGRLLDAVELGLR